MEKGATKQEVEGTGGVQPKTASLASFHERFDFLIRARLMTQLEVAEHLGIGQPHVSGLRSGRTAPSKKVISRIATVFGCNTEWLHLGLGEAFTDENKLPKELQLLIDEMKETYDRLASDREKFEFQNEVYNYFKAFKQSLDDRKK